MLHLDHTTDLAGKDILVGKQVENIFTSYTTRLFPLKHRRPRLQLRLGLGLFAAGYPISVCLAAGSQLSRIHIINPTLTKFLAPNCRLFVYFLFLCLSCVIHFIFVIPTDLRSRYPSTSHPLPPSSTNLCKPPRPLFSLAIFSCFALCSLLLDESRYS